MPPRCLRRRSLLTDALYYFRIVHPTSVTFGVEYWAPRLRT